MLFGPDSGLDLATHWRGMTSDTSQQPNGGGLISIGGLALL